MPGSTPGVVERKNWGARPPTCTSSNVHPGRGGFAIHYSGSDADEQADHANCAGRVRGIQTYHMQTRKWCDIAYNFLVCKHGYIYRGRNWGIRSAAQGTNDGNSRYLAICFLGNDSKDRADFTEEAKQAFIYLIYRGRTAHGVGQEVKPHSHFHATSCPGDEIRAFIKAQYPEG